MRRLAVLLAFAALAASAAACGSSPPPAVESPPAAPADAGPADAPVDVAPPPPTASIACRSRANLCAEYQGISPEDADKLKQQCAGEKGQVLDACPSAKVVGTCAATRGAVTVRQVFYRAKTVKETHLLVDAGKQACESKGGTFTETTK